LFFIATHPRGATPSPCLCNYFLLQKVFTAQLSFSANEHAGPQGFAVRKKRSKKSKKGVTMKVWLCCDRAGVAKASDLGRLRKRRITQWKRKR